jgi:dTDP-4-amino-4,6-dideoxygalactose transaminase
MNAAGVNLQVHYIPVHLQPYYRREYGFKRGDYPVSETFYEREISLPMFPGVTDEVQKTVVSQIKESLCV